MICFGNGREGGIGAGALSIYRESGAGVLVRVLSSLPCITTLFWNITAVFALFIED